MKQRRYDRYDRRRCGLLCSSQIFPPAHPTAPQKKPPRTEVLECVGSFPLWQQLVMSILVSPSQSLWICLPFDEEPRSEKAKTQARGPTRLTGRTGSGSQDFL